VGEAGLFSQNDQRFDVGRQAQLTRLFLTDIFLSYISLSRVAGEGARGDAASSGGGGGGGG